MGNTFNTFNYKQIKFVNLDLKQNYIHKIEIDKFNIEDIKIKLILLNNNQITNLIDNVITVLKHIEKIENYDLLNNIDGYLFEKHNCIPFLQIININAQQNRKINNINTDGFYYLCNLNKTFDL